jgi:heme A synthase
VTHLPQSVETAIELTHRVTSGLSLLVVVGLTIWTYRSHDKGHPARRWSMWACVFMVSESLVGAALVLLSLVGRNDSWQRAAVMAVHLVNTSLLTFAMLASAYFCGRTRKLRWSQAGARRAMLCLSAVLIISGAGAVTALGDTIYPVAQTSPIDVAAQSTNQMAHFLERIRGLHPILALLGAFFVLHSLESFRVGAPRRLVLGLTFAQLLAGVLNVWLSAPGWMQVVHLALANGLWLALSWILLDEATAPGVERGPLDSPIEPGTVHP